MNVRTLAAASAALGVLVAASAANAAITVNTSPGYPVADDLFGVTLGLNDQQMLWDFDAIANANVDFSGNVLQGPQTGGESASPPYGGSQAGDTTKFSSVQGGDTSVFSTLGDYYLTSFSFYIGSPDAYNHMVFNMSDGTSQAFDGNEIWGGTPSDPGGNRDMGFRVYYDFGGAHVTSIEFSSDEHAFESDGFAGQLGVPEPNTWALMIMGFGGAGAMIRRRKAALA
jgi:hypothetical protein